MDNIDVITDLILKEAQEKSAVIIENATKELNSYKENQSKLLQTDYEKTREDIKNRIEGQQSDILDRKKIWARKEIASYKQELFLNVYTLAEEKLNNISKDKFLIFFSEAVKKCQLTGDCTVVFGEANKARLNEEDISAIEGNGTQYNIIISEENIKNSGGFLIVQDILEYDFLYKSLLNELNNQKGGEILNKLFE